MSDGPCDEAIRKNLGVTFSALLNNSSSSKEILNTELTAVAAGAFSFSKTILLGAGAFLVVSLPLIWALRKPKNNPISKAYREGHLAFQNALDENRNPYLDKDEKLSKSWLDGYKNALKIRNKKGG